MNNNNELLIKNVRPLGGDTVDILVSQGVIERIGPQLSVEHPTAPSVEGDNHILLPGFVDAHTHLDNTFWGLPWQPHLAGPRLIDRIENERCLLRELKLSPQKQSNNQVRQAISQGTTHIRTHVDVDTEIGLANIEGVLATRDSLRDVISMQLVAFPQSGLLCRPGTVDNLEAAIEAGADLVGGIDPGSMDRNAAGHLDAIFGIADRQGVGVDIHLHDPGSLGANTIELIAERTRALGMAGQVTISHAFCLGMVEDPYLQQLIELLQENRIAIMTHAPGHVEFPPIKPLREAGIQVCSGSDGIRDAWGPYGNADMLERAMLLGYRSNFRKDEELEMVLDITTFGGAEVMGVKSYGLEVGCQADFVLVAGETRAEAVVNRSPRKTVVKNGRVVAVDGQCII